MVIKKAKRIFGSKIIFIIFFYKNLYVNFYTRFTRSARLTNTRAKLIGITTITVPNTKLFKNWNKEGVIF